MAKLWGTLANGGSLNGKRLLKSPGILGIPQAIGVDKLTNWNTTYGPGTFLFSKPEVEQTLS